MDLFHSMCSIIALLKLLPHIQRTYEIYEQTMDWATSSDHYSRGLALFVTVNRPRSLSNISARAIYGNDLKRVIPDYMFRIKIISTFC